MSVYNTSRYCSIIHIIALLLQRVYTHAVHMHIQIRTHLSQGLCVGAHVSEDDQHVLLTLVGQELSRSQSQTGSDDTLDTAWAVSGGEGFEEGDWRRGI